MIVQGVFGLAAVVVGWVYFGYPIVLYVVSRLRRRPVRRAPHEPSVSLIICAYNEEPTIRRKLDECLALDYPAELLEIIVASDGSTDRTDEIVREYEPRIRLIRVEGRRGKTIAQNEAVRQATGEILAFSDVTTEYPPGTIRALTANFADPDVGCVGGDITYYRGDNPSAEGRAVFWNYERWMRLAESEVHSMIGVAGCAYAMRADLYQPLEPEIISDFVAPGLVTAAGHRTILDASAPVYEPAESFGLGEELRRRSRVITRGLRGCFRMPMLLNPFRHPWFAIVLWSHRVLRWTLPLFLLALFATAGVMRNDHWIFALIFWGQAGVWLSGGVAFLLDRMNVRAPGLFVPLYFCLISIAPLLAMVSLIRGDKQITWETKR